MINRFVLGSTCAVAIVLVVGVAGALGTGRPRSVVASSVASIAGAGETGIQIQNLDPSAAADISAAFYVSAGALAQTIHLPVTPPGAAANIYLAATTLPKAAYAVVANADRHIAAIARTDWASTGGAAMYSNVIPGKSIVVPMVVRHRFGQSSLIWIQNTDTRAMALVTMDFYETGAATPTASRDYSIPAGTSIRLHLGPGGDEPEFHELGSFLGTAFVTSTTEVGVMTFIDVTTTDKAVYAFEGVPVEMASPTLYVPLFRAKQYPRPGDPASGRMDTGISVVNPGAAAVEVAVTYYGAGGSCAGETVSSPPATIDGHSSHVFYQGAPGSQGLKDDCYGSAVIRSSGGGILAIVNDAQNLNQTSAAYNAVSADQGGKTIALPLLRKGHHGFTTGVAVMNMGTESAQITLSFLDPMFVDGPPCGASCTQTVGPNQTAIFWFGAIASMPAGLLGSGTIQSTQPVAVVVNDVNFSGNVDWATYNGIKVDAGGPLDGAFLPASARGVSWP